MLFCSKPFGLIGTDFFPGIRGTAENAFLVGCDGVRG